MKKYNEGYALPFVLVVSVVMCLIAVTVMSFSLKNLQVQQDSVQRTQAKYDAAGRIEEVIAIEKNTSGAASYYASENLKLLVSADEKSMKIAASDELGRIWIIAKVKPNDVETGKITMTYENDLNGDQYATLTMANCEGLVFEVYQVVDEQTAIDFLTPQGETGDKVWPK